MINLAAHYAKALVAYAGQLDRLEAFYGQAKNLLDGKARPPEPEIAGEIAKFLQIVPRKSRGGVLRLFVRDAYERLGLLDAKVISPTALTKGQVSALGEKLEKLTGKKPVMEVYVDETLIGGLKMVTQTALYDESIGGQIGKLRKEMCGEVAAHAK
jgi:F0F1-type ATP synthase delta subunit